VSANARILQEQIEYYRSCASEYDDWFFRRGRYDRGAEVTGRWFEQVEQVRQALRAVPLDHCEVVELAPGTGLWTQEIAGRARHPTAVDASVEMIELNRARLGPIAAKVDFIVGDLFTWTPSREFDAVVFCFWISHVPAKRLGAFLERVSRMIRPGGSVFFLDGLREQTSTARDHVLPSSDGELMTRRLDDGREFSIVKNFWDSRDLESRCAQVGLQVSVHETAEFFQYGVGTRV